MLGPSGTGKSVFQWFRVHFLPPQQPPATWYEPNRGRLPVQGEHGCRSRHGPGVGPSSQPQDPYITPGSQLEPGAWDGRAARADRLRSPPVTRPDIPNPARGFRDRALPWTIAAVAIAASATFGALWWGERAEDARREAVEEAARGFLVALTNFRAGTIDRDLAEIRSFAVGAFAAEVDETFSADRLEAIRTNQAESRGRVRSLFVQRLTGDSASVFGVVEETVANSASPEPRTEVLRVELGLIQTTEAWKVDRVEILQSPSGGPAGF
jgi:Mce-associated membrane protein